MKLWDYLKDKGMLLLLHLVCACVMTLFLRLTGYGRANCMLILCFWAMILGIWLAFSFLQRRRFFRETKQILEKMDQRYLLGELLPASFRLEDRLYREMIRKSNKSVIERIRRMEDEQKAYREYMESWVHEIKAPITGISLLCENRRRSGGRERRPKEEKEDFRIISLENQKIENYVDMVLYYARSEEVYQDYLIRETDLEKVVLEVLDRNRLLLIQSGVRVEMDCKASAYTDEKWIAFIFNQMLLNSIKYCGESPCFYIAARREKNNVILSLTDNGTGIPGEELPRIFEKGFTGSNGRKKERSTGMGLYLCRKLCDKLGIGITASFEFGKGTEMRLEFPISDYISRG